MRPRCVCCGYPERYHGDPNVPDGLPICEDYEPEEEYDPNAEAERAYEREMDSRLARERDRAWEDLNLDGREP